MCRAVLQSLLAERPLLCYRKTRSLVRSLYNERYFNFYEEQTGEAAGIAALHMLESGIVQNPGARNYLLGEKRIQFYESVDWRDKVLAASKILYDHDGQIFEPKDVVPLHAARSSFWRVFELIS